MGFFLLFQLLFYSYYSLKFVQLPRDEYIILGKNKKRVRLEYDLLILVFVENVAKMLPYCVQCTHFFSV